MHDELTDLMQDLRDRVRAASGPDRDLDAEISWRLAPEIPGAGLRPRGGAGDGPAPSGPTVFGGLFPDWRTRDDVVPRYTGSVDAALALAGENAEAALRHALDHPHSGTRPLGVGLALGIVQFVVDRL